MERMQFMVSSGTRIGRFCLFVVGVFVTQIGVADAAHVSWQRDFRQAARQATELNKPLLVEITASWCHYCKKMKKSFADEQVARHVNNCFIPVIVDADRDKKLVQAIGIEGLPTTVIISPEFEVVKKITGFQTAAQLDRQLAGICQVGHEEETPQLASKPAAPVESELAFNGYCLVSLLERRTLEPGSELITGTYKGAKLRFASAEDKRRFDSNPQKYWPVLDGACPVTAADENRVNPGRPRSGAVYDGRLWFFADDALRARFAKSPKKYAAER